MTGTGRARVEFVDPVPRSGAPGTDGVGTGTGSRPDFADESPAGPRRSARWLLPALVVLVGVGVLARLIGAPAPATSPAPRLGPVYGGSVALPGGFGAPVALAAPSTGGRDLLYVLGATGRVARVLDGAVTGTSTTAGYRVLTVRPDGGMVYAATLTPSPTLVALDPVSLTPVGHVLPVGPVSALAAGPGTVWAATAAAVQGWSGDLAHPLDTLALPAQVTRVATLAAVGAELQATVALGPDDTALLRLTPPAGTAWITSAYAGPVSIVAGNPALVAHVDPGRFVQVLRDPAPPGSATAGGKQVQDASIWPAAQVGTAAWLVSSASSPTLDCHDASGALVGRATVGDEAKPIIGAVAATAAAIYAVTGDARLARGSHASCGVPPASVTGGRPGGV